MKPIFNILAKKYRIRPEKRLGQNFLIDKQALKKIVQTADIGKKDFVLEIGPGLGALTQEMVIKAKEIIAVEKDKKIAEALKKEFKGFKNLKIINRDILKFNFPSLKLEFKNYKIVANLPFYVAAPTIRKFLEAETKPKEMVLIIQKEVAQRICARPPKMNILAVSVQFYSQPKIISYLSKKSFWPVPKVDSAIIKITPNNRFHFQSSRRFREQFFKIVKAGFSQPKKQLLNNLSKKLAPKLSNKLKSNKKEISRLLLKNGIQPSQRPGTLTLKDWTKLAKMLK